MELNNNEADFKPPKVCTCAPEEYDPPIEDHATCLTWIGNWSPMWLPEKSDGHKMKNFCILLKKISKERIQKWTKTSKHKIKWVAKQREALNWFRIEYAKHHDIDGERSRREYDT